MTSDSPNSTDLCVIVAIDAVIDAEHEDHPVKLTWSLPNKGSDEHRGENKRKYVITKVVHLATGQELRPDGTGVWAAPGGQVFTGTFASRSIPA